MSASPTYRIAVDIGGTFTDTVLVDKNNQVLATAKTATTHSNPTDGALEGVSVVVEDSGVKLVDIDGFIHGTTLATNALIEKSTWEITLFCPYKGKKAKDWLDNIRQNKNIKIVFFNDTPIEGLSSWNRFFMGRGWGLPRPHNVLIPAISMAINSGYKEIYLAGADHSWLPMISVNDKNQALVNQQHFYDENATKSDLMYKLGMRPRRLHEILEKFMFTFRSYFDLKDYAESRGVQIYNSTPDSYIDAFERKAIP